MIDTIISGGQTGADQGGLFAAKELGITTGGMAPKGWRTEAGSAPWLEEYGLVEHSSDNYRLRTEANVKAADGTVIFGKRSIGGNLTEEFCRLHDKPWIWISDVTVRAMLPLWIRRYSIKILNVAGNRESKNPGIGQFTKDFLIKALR